MSELTDEIRVLIDEASEEEQRIVLKYLLQRLPPHPLEQAWGTTAEAIMTAIARSPDLTQRGIRGILAEAAFDRLVLPELMAAGWNAAPIDGHPGYDFLLQKASKQVRIQVKLQRREKGVPKEYRARDRAALNCPSGKTYVVEVQKTRGGEKKGQKTRPYRFSDFDILAVNQHPSTGNWQHFLYTVSNWLLPHPKEPKLIKTMQPVPERADEYWTDDFARCVKWFLAGTRKRLYSHRI